MEKQTEWRWCAAQRSGKLIVQLYFMWIGTQKARARARLFPGTTEEGKKQWRHNFVCLFDNDIGRSVKMLDRIAAVENRPLERTVLQLVENTVR